MPGSTTDDRGLSPDTQPTQGSTPTPPITGLDATIQKQLDLALAEQATLMQQAAELDPDGTPSANAFLAQKRLDTVNAFIRNMMTTLQAQGKITDAQAAAAAKTTADQAKADALKAEQDRKDKLAQDKLDEQVKNQQATQARLAQNDTSRLGIEQQNANTSSQNSALQAARDQVDAEYKRIASQVAQGQLSNEQAIERFKEVVDQFTAQRDALTTAMTAGDNAAKYAEMATKNAVGPQFGAHFAQGLQGVAQAKPGMVNYGPSDFTYPTPDYQGIAAKATAAALAHLSPFAAQLAQQHAANQGAAIPGYQPQPTPDVIGQAAASVVGQQPGYRPAGS